MLLLSQVLNEVTEDNLIDLGPGSPAVVSPMVGSSTPAASLSSQLAGLGECLLGRLAGGDLSCHLPPLHATHLSLLMGGPRRRHSAPFELLPLCCLGPETTAGPNDLGVDSCHRASILLASSWSVPHC